MIDKFLENLKLKIKKGDIRSNKCQIWKINRKNKDKISKLEKIKDNNIKIYALFAFIIPSISSLHVIISIVNNVSNKLSKY
jgi:hypothetical protein